MNRPTAFNRTASRSSDTGAWAGVARPHRWRVSLVAMALSVAVACLASSSALAANARSATTIVGNASAGKSLFSTNCGTCHTLKAAGSAGTIGPNLNTVSPALSETTIIAAIDNGGASVMTKAAASKYAVTMEAYKGTLPTTTVDDIAAFVYTSTHATVVVVAKASVTSFTPTKGKAGTKVTITGKNFTGASSVKIDALKATFKVVSSTKITATVPAKAKTGKISVTTKAGTATSAKALTIS
jgi:mono/diheme cytochrome c family protein